MTGTCPIWGTSAELLPKVGDFQDVISPRAGGSYRLMGTAAPAVSTAGNRIKARLTTWLVDQRRGGIPNPVVTLSELKSARDRRALSVSDRKERLFRAIRSLDPDLHFKFRLSGLVDEEYHRWHNLFGSWTESSEPGAGDVVRLCNLVEQDGLLRIDHDLGHLTTHGWSYLEQLTRSGVETSQVFVAMWFSDEMMEAYSEGISAAVQDAGYVPLRIDRKEHNNKIDDEIIAEIKLSRFLIADFTSGEIDVGAGSVHVPRGGVYYEAGFARGLGMEVISCVRADQVGAVHFDTRQISHVLWDTPADLRSRLYSRIVATVGAAPGARGRGGMQ